MPPQSRCSNDLLRLFQIGVPTKVSQIVEKWIPCWNASSSFGDGRFAGNVVVSVVVVVVVDFVVVAADGVHFELFV